MSLSIWLVFLAASLVTTFSPGPAILLAISNSVAFGPKKALLSSVGNATGIFLVSSAAMAGLGVVLNTSALLFGVFKLAGAAYLIYLGVRQWRSKANIFEQQVQVVPAAGEAHAKFFRQGLLVAVTNPKSILFFTALFPQFIKPEVSVPEQFFVLTLTFALCAILAHCFYVLLARRMRGWFSSRRRAQLFNRISGGAFVVLGLGVFRLKNSAG
ncbi:LysE family translocator [Undibacterium sp. TJN25]|uniref:LysE family translocator n=1 Tax=Undibacterium sp. TJN25 TaxID=3413056 RepID=UPI003BF31DAF